MKTLDAKKIHKLLIRGTNWVGDSVLSLPALKEVRRVFDQAHITLLVLPWVSGLYRDCAAVDEVLIYDRGSAHRGLVGRLKLIRELRRRQFDAAILFQNAFEAAVLTALAGIPNRAGYNRDCRGWLLSHPLTVAPKISRLHQSYYYLDLVEQLLGRHHGALNAREGRPCDFEPSEMPDIGLRVSSQRIHDARESLRLKGVNTSRLVVGVNPGAFFGSAKRWPAERYAKLLDRLIEQHNTAAVIFGSTNELSIAESIRASMQWEPIVMTGKTELSDLVAMIACCDLFITNDSGPMHLAAALGVPLVAIFGSTDEVATGPMTSKALVINKRVECSPCLLRECPIDHRCMTRIEVDDVYDAAAHLLLKR